MMNDKGFSLYQRVRQGRRHVQQSGMQRTGYEVGGCGERDVPHTGKKITRNFLRKWRVLAHFELAGTKIALMHWPSNSVTSIHFMAYLYPYQTPATTNESNLNNLELVSNTFL